MKIKIPKLQIWIVIFYVNVILCTINFLLQLTHIVRIILEGQDMKVTL